MHSRTYCAYTFCRVSCLILIVYVHYVYVSLLRSQLSPLITLVHMLSRTCSSHSSRVVPSSLPKGYLLKWFRVRTCFLHLTVLIFVKICERMCFMFFLMMANTHRETTTSEQLGWNRTFPSPITKTSQQMSMQWSAKHSSDKQNKLSAELNCDLFQTENCSLEGDCNLDYSNSIWQNHSIWCSKMWTFCCIICHFSLSLLQTKNNK